MDSVSGLRELTPAEWELVSGGVWTDGFGNPEIFVNGGGYWYSYDMWGDSVGYGGGGDGGDRGGAGDDSPPYDYANWLQQECAADLAVDMIARQIEALIKATPDWNAREYGAIIYMVDGEVRMGPLTRGMTVAEAVALGLDAPQTRFSTPSDLGNGVILAVVHSHPDVGYTNAEDLQNNYPSYYTGSDGNASGDYATFESLVGSDSRFSNSAAFAQYILGPDGVLREFNARDGRLNPVNDPNAASRSNLVSDRPCNS